MLRQIRASPDLHRIPVVVLTSSREESDLVRSYELGVNAYGIYVVDVVSGGPADQAGLKAGDRVVTAGQQRVQRDGTAVVLVTGAGDPPVPGIPVRVLGLAPGGGHRRAPCRRRGARW